MDYLRNPIELDADIDQPAISEAPLVTQGDSIELTINILKGGEPFDLSNVTQTVLVISRSDGQVIIDGGTVVEGTNKVVFRMRKSSTLALGTTRFTVQIFDEEVERVSTMFGVYVVMEDASGRFEDLPEDEQTLIQEVLGEGPAIVESMQTTVKALDQVLLNAKYINPYNVEETYYINNIVSYNGNSYIAKRESTGELPPDPEVASENEYWGLLGRKGDDGVGTVHTKEDVFIAEEGQSLFELTHTYDMFQGRTTVTVDGVPQFPGEHYTELTDNKIQLVEGVPEGTRVSVKYFTKAVPLQGDHEEQISQHTQAISNINNTVLQNHQEVTLQLAQTENDLLQREVNVKQPPFNAKGNGTDDDSFAIQQAIDYVKSIGGGVVYIPRGIYLFGNPATNNQVRVPENVTVRGAGMGLTQITLKDYLTTGTSATTNLLSIEGDNVVLSDITIDGNRHNQTWEPIGSANYGAQILGSASNCLFERVETKNVTANGMGVAGSGNNITFSNCLSHGNGKKGIHTANPTNLSIIGGEFFNNELDSGIGLHQGATDVKIINVKCHSNGTSGVHVGATVGSTKNITIMGCTFLDNKTAGVAIGGTGSTKKALERIVNIIACRFFDDMGVLVTGTRYVDITACDFDNSKVELRVAFDVGIFKNNFINCPTDFVIKMVGGSYGGIDFTQGENNQVTINKFTGIANTAEVIQINGQINAVIENNDTDETPTGYFIRDYTEVALINELGKRVRIGTRTYADGVNNKDVLPRYASMPPATMKAGMVVVNSISNKVYHSDGEVWRDFTGVPL